MAGLLEYRIKIKMDFSNEIFADIYLVYNLMHITTLIFFRKSKSVFTVNKNKLMDQCVICSVTNGMLCVRRS